MSSEQPKEDLDALRNNLRELKKTLDKQREEAQNELFNNFLDEIMKLDLNDKKAESLRKEYLDSLQHLSDEERPLGDRVSEFIESDFLYGVLTHKNLRYEREIKRFLNHLNDMLASASQEGATKESKFIERYFSNALSGVLDIIEPEEAEGNKQMAEMIVGALQEPLKNWFR